MIALLLTSLAFGGGLAIGEAPPAGFTCSATHCQGVVTIENQEANASLELCDDGTVSQISIVVGFVPFGEPFPGVTVTSRPIEAAQALYIQRGGDLSTPAVTRDGIWTTTMVAWFATDVQTKDGFVTAATVVDTAKRRGDCP